MSTPQKVSPLHVALWGLWVIAAWITYLEGSWQAALGIGVAFAVLEGWGVARKGAGDTFTETVRAFYAGLPGRAILVLGITGFLGLWFLSFVPRFSHLYDWAGFSLGIGLILWLPLHFFFKKIA